jgi:hypothetical protein
MERARAVLEAAFSARLTRLTQAQRGELQKLLERLCAAT